MAKDQELTPEQKKENKAKLLEKRNSLIFKQIQNLARKNPEQRMDTLSVITHQLPFSMFKEAIESKTLKEDYVNWLQENAPHIFRKSGGGGGTRAKVERLYPSWIDKVENAPAGLIKAGKEFQTNLNQFIEDNNKLIVFFGKEYGEHWSQYFRLGNKE